jgi:hypothetical protein
MHSKNYLYLTLSCFVAGLLFMALQQNWIILRFSSSILNHESPSNSPSVSSFKKKKITLFCWKNDSWFSESNEILWSSDSAQNITNLVQSWLTLLDEEKLTSNKITLQSALLTANSQTAYLSFDQTLFSKDASTYQKLMVIEGLLKTLRANHLTTPFMQFLTQHQVAKDSHLDFSNPWPITGFLTS